MRQHPRPRPSPLPQFQRSPSVFPSFPQVNPTAPVSSPPLSPILKTPSPPLSSTLPPLLPPPPPRPPPQTWKRLSPEEIASRRERGLCFNCEEKFHRGHRCSSRFFLLISDEDDPPLSHIPNFDPPITLTNDPIPTQPTDPPESPPSYSAQISLNSLAGHVAPETIRFIGAISGHPLLLLVDGGSTHNFVQQQLVTQLGLSCRTTSPLRVMVGNGQYLECHSICEAISVQIQNHNFTVDLHVLPISGANVVLGVQWLKTLGPVLTDYSTLSMQFIHNDQLITLQGDPEASLSSMSSSQFRRLCRTQPQGLYFQITILANDTPPSSPDTLPPSLQALLTKYAVLFQPSPTLPPPRPTDHHIHLLPSSTPVNVRPYRYPHFQKQEIELQVESMLQKGLIQPSTSPFSSPVLLVKKHDGSWRFCVDYRALNSLTVKDRFPIPTIDELLDELGGAQCFSKLDLLQGYHQIRMHSEDIPKTAFRTHHGHYEFRVMPFGLCNAPSSFQATMNFIFRPFLRRFVIVFFDDILIYSSSFEDHLRHLDLTFQVLLDNHFVLKKSKCSFGQSQVEYLGHLVSQRGVEPMSDKVAAIVNWPQPHSTRAVRSFLGLAGFYRRFIRGYAMIAEPLVKATSDPFRWTPQAQQAFEALKSALSTAPVLSLPDFQEPFTVETDASGNGMGAILSQRGHPIAYFSKPFPKKLLRASTYVRELFAITSAVKKWRQYLLGHSFTIVTDHRSLKELLTQVIQTPEQHMYLARLMGFDYQIQYRSGKHNQAADALSRSPDFHPSLSLLLSIPCLTFLEELRQQLANNPQYCQRRQDFINSPASYPDFTLSQNFLLYKGKIWLPRELPLIQTLMQEYHATPMGGHMGVAKTTARLSENFMWPGLRSDVATFVANCTECQFTKYETKRTAGLLCPLPVPFRPWEDLSLDFITGLPSYQGKTVLLVVVDRFSKGIHLGILPTAHTAHMVASLFIDIVVKLHGQPRSLVSDRDPLFMSTFWQELFKLSGTRLRMSSAYHPQSDGQTEVMNRVIEQYLRAFVHRRPGTWGRFLPWIELSHNTSWNVGTGSTPYEITFGRKPFSFPDYITGSSKLDAVDDILKHREEVFLCIRQKLLKAQAAMKQTADAKRREVEYEVGAWVLLKLRPYRQRSAKEAPANSGKLAKRFYGPFLILEKIGKVAYRLKLPEGARIHPVFHCSLLKPFHGASVTSDTPSLPDQFLNNQPIISPLAILDTRRAATPEGSWEVLVQWKGLLPDDTSWEDWEQLKQTHHLEDKVILQGPREDDSNRATPEEEIEKAADMNTGVQTAKPKRRITRPAYLRDYA